ncbi:MAG: nucleotide exchange factor GrpE [Verrucomicrobia bacterium]|nr:nucleotide exchange factor GrpE [Verrucomicrobiota bacterium]MDA1085774.1 nucleotide exchange factor GrpE [Verrucomicrobiota bacterium]
MKKTEDSVIENDETEETPASDGGEVATDSASAQDACAEDSGDLPEGAEGELGAVTERLLRLQADFDNFRKRTLRERHETLRRATDDVLLELLPVLDHFELALQAAADHDADTQIVQGFQLVGDQIAAALEKFGLTPIEAEGQDFDHNLHEAISRIASGEQPDGKVVNQVRRGYKSGERLLRPAQVVVSSGSPEAPAVDAGQAAQDED